MELGADGSWLQSAAIDALALVLAFAAGSKLRSAGGLRLFGSQGSVTLVRLLAPCELLLGVAALALPADISAPVLAALFTAFALAHLRAWHARVEDCGCLGQRRTTVGVRSVMLSLGAAALAGWAWIGDPRSPVALAIHRPVTSAAASLGAGLLAAAWLAAFSAVPRADARSVSERLVTASALLLERRLSRRTALVRIATAGSALCVAPLRYLLYPGTALAAIIPGDCSDGLCTDGYTAFCCEINKGVNACPSGTFTGGWWKCTDYAGRRLCTDEGVRYYVDCNRLPGTHFPGGCHCADDSCAHRRVACNVFRYGQCNTQIQPMTEVVCRMVVCENPSTIPALNCGASLSVDDAVCGQDTPCLEPPPTQLTGAGGVLTTVAIVVEGAVIALLVLFVVALLRSHAEILRRLAALDSPGARRETRATDPTPAADGASVAADIVGETLAGDAVKLALSGGSPRTLLSFLSSGCAACSPLWDELRAGVALPAGLRLVVLTKDAAEESLSRLRTLAPPAEEVVMSTSAWRALEVPVTPHFVLVDGVGGRILGRGSAGTWEQILQLLGDAERDAALTVTRPLGSSARAARAEDALARAGVTADDPSLYPSRSPTDPR